MLLHIQQRLDERGINLPLSYLFELANQCNQDTAVILQHSEEIKGDLNPNFHCRSSNGDIVILIIRNHKLVTVMYRRSNQITDEDTLHVCQILDKSQGD